MSPLDRSYRPPYLGTVAPSLAARLRAHVEQTRARAQESTERQLSVGEERIAVHMSRCQWCRRELADGGALTCPTYRVLAGAREGG